MTSCILAVDATRMENDLEKISCCVAAILEFGGMQGIPPNSRMARCTRTKNFLRMATESATFQAGDRDGATLIAG